MTTLKIDPHKSWIPLREKADEISNEKHKILLNEVANHMEAEIKGQLDPLMNTLTAEPVYHFWRVSDVNMILNGYEEVSSFYSNMFQNGGEQFEVVTKRIIVNNNEKIIVVQIAGLIARRILSFISENDTMVKGERIGLIRFGSRVDIYLPLSYQINVNENDIVVAGQTIIAER